MKSDGVSNVSCIAFVLRSGTRSSILHSSIATFCLLCKPAIQSYAILAGPLLPRPQQQTPAMQSLNSTEGVGEVVKRKRGRPRKTVPAPAAEETHHAAVLSGDQHQMVHDCVDGVITTAYSADGSCAHSSSQGVVQWLGSTLRNMFLPEGYPGSVSPDYLAFQGWDTVQAVSSYIRGQLTSQAILRGVGVGQQAATPLAAVFMFFVRDLAGMLGGILFAYWQGSSFDTCAKQWRLFADVTNDVGMAVELASPLFPGAFMAMACFGSMARAVTGVAAGATRAALTQHFAQRGNAADVMAKEQSQETATTLLGMVLGMVFTRLTAGHEASAWPLFVLLTILHIWANIRALRSLVLSSVNDPRLELLVEQYVRRGRVPAPLDVAAEEDLTAPPLRPLTAWLQPWTWGQPRPAPIFFGLTLSQAARRAHITRRDVCGAALQAGAEGQAYVVVNSPSAVIVALHKDRTSPADLLRARVHAQLLSRLPPRNTRDITAHSPTDYKEARGRGEELSSMPERTRSRSRGRKPDSPASPRSVWTLPRSLPAAALPAGHALEWSQDWMRHHYGFFLQACREAGWEVERVPKVPRHLISYPLLPRHED